MAVTPMIDYAAVLFIVAVYFINGIECQDVSPEKANHVPRRDVSVMIQFVSWASTAGYIG